MSPRRQAGFTLLEVLIAVLFVASVGSAISVIVSDTLRSLSRTDDRLTAMAYAEQKAREIVDASRDGSLPELGVTEGEVESLAAAAPGIDGAEDREGSAGTATPGYEPWLWETSVEEYEIELPDEDKDLAAASPIFANPKLSSNQRNPVLRRITIRVYPEGGDVETADSFIVFAVEPTSPGLFGIGEDGADDERDDEDEDDERDGDNGGSSGGGSGGSGSSGNAPSFGSGINR